MKGLAQVVAGLLVAAAATATAAEPVRPPMTEGDPAPGKFVKQTAPEYRGTGVYHALYLPTNWQPGKTYPVIVEYAPNPWKEGGGTVEDCRMGYYQSGGRDFLWVVMPYVDPVKKENVRLWWGDEDATVRYCLTNLRRICEQYGGDPNAIFLTGFSRGAIACGYLGLRDETIADVWLAFLPHSHIDSGRFTAKGGRERLVRTRGRATFVSWGEKDSGKTESPKGAAILRELGFPVVEREVPGAAHTDRWIEQDSPLRREMREWIAGILKTRPGTYTVRGRVEDGKGGGVAGVRVRCGSWHWAITDAEGRYEIRSLVPGSRTLTASKNGYSLPPVGLRYAIVNQDVTAEPIVLQDYPTLFESESKAPRPLGLSVQGGVLMKDGRPYRGVGANYFSLFARLLKDPEDKSSLENLKALSRAGVPFVRFMCGGFWPVEQRQYLKDPEAYFKRLDLVVRCAEENRVGLIPSLFWHTSTVSDLVGEPLDQLGNPGSKSIALIRKYTEDVVRRYENSPAIWGWEFGNEYNLGADLPNAATHRPPAVPKLGTPAERTERDELKFAHLRTAFVVFAETVRKFDRERIIFSGNSIPRASAWHNFYEKSWKADTEAQFGEILLRDNPDPMNSVTIHLYREDKDKYPGGAASIDEAAGLAARCAAKAGKPLFIGEFGAARAAGSREAQQALFEEFLRAIEKHRVPLAAFWVFDLAGQDKDWNVTFQNDRAFMIELVSKANERLRAEKQEKP